MRPKPIVCVSEIYFNFTRRVKIGVAEDIMIVLITVQKAKDDYIKSHQIRSDNKIIISNHIRLYLIIR